MARITAALLILALSACATPPPAQTAAAETPPGTVNVHMHGEMQFLYGVRSSIR